MNFHNKKTAQLFKCCLLWIIAHKETVCQSQALKRWIAGVFLGNDSLKQIELLVVFLSQKAEPQCSITMSGQVCAVKALGPVGIYGPLSIHSLIQQENHWLWSEWWSHYIQDLALYSNEPQSAIICQLLLEVELYFHW